MDTKLMAMAPSDLGGPSHHHGDWSNQEGPQGETGVGQDSVWEKDLLQQGEHLTLNT